MESSRFVKYDSHVVVMLVVTLESFCVVRGKNMSCLIKPNRQHKLKKRRSYQKRRRNFMAS